MNRRGFTLIELLVVIAVISLLSSVVFASLNSARAKGRNTKTIQDIQQLINAFNLGRTDNNSFPIRPPWACVSQTCDGAWSVYEEDPVVDVFFTPYMSQKPSDPYLSNNRGGYLYGNPWDPAGIIWPSGAYLYYLLEKGGVCVGGKIYDASPSDYDVCVFQLDA